VTTMTAVDKGVKELEAEDRRARTAFETAVAKAKIEDFTLHSCRHHFASWFMMNGGSLLSLNRILGHATLAMTTRYAHLSPDHLKNEMERTERAGATTALLEPDLGANGGRCLVSTGAGGGSRTRDLLITNQLLCH
jgi:hypothetical protein